MIVGRFEMIPASKGSGQHENGGFWRMEVGNQCVDDFELEARVNKDIVFAFGFAGFAPEFESARDGSTDSNNTMTGFFGGLDCFDGGFWDMEPLGVHVVFFDVVAADWQESAETDVKGEIFDLDTFVFELFDELLGHIKAGGWSGSGAVFFGPDSLVALDVGLSGVATHVWRKWNVAVLLGDLVERGFAFGERNAVAENLFDSNLSIGFFAGFVIDDREQIAIVKFATIHDVVEFGIVAFENDEFARAAIWQFGKDAAAHNASVVKNNQIAWLKKICKLSIFAIGDFAGLAIECE